MAEPAVNPTTLRSQSGPVGSTTPVDPEQQNSPGNAQSSVNEPPITTAKHQEHGRTPRPTTLKNKDHTAAQPAGRGRGKYGAVPAVNRAISLAPQVTNDDRGKDVKETQNKTRQPDVKEELRRLQEEEMIKFGKKQRGLIDDAPQTGPLHVARQGPGTDPTSPIAQGFARLVTTEGKAMPISPISDDKSDDDTERPALIRDPGDHRLNVSKPYNALTDDKDAEGWKTDLLLVDWQFRPWQTHTGEQFVRNFRTWLENTMSVGYPLDTNGKSFVDGTSHNDGINGLVEEDFECEDSFLELSDPGNKHAHETAAGYAYNWVVRQQKGAQGRARQKQATVTNAKSSYKEPETNPYAPRAKTYLRPVETKDIAQLVNLCNWYVKNTERVTDLDEITQKEMKEFIAEAENQNLPFLVAAQQKPGVWHAMNSEDEMVHGYIGALDFAGYRTTSRYTAELQLFVHPGIHRHGIGRCLVDKMLQILDPQYPAKRGYYFDCPNEKRNVYDSGGHRPMSRLVFVVHHRADDVKEYAWLKKWLEKDFGFEEQGLLKGVGIKNKKM